MGGKDFRELTARELAVHRRELIALGHAAPGIVQEQLDEQEALQELWDQDDAASVPTDQEG